MDPNLVDTLNADVVQIAHEQPKSFGSGRLVAPGVILTARHVAEDGTGRGISDKGWKVRLMADRPSGASLDAPAWGWRDAKVAWRRVAGAGVDLDLALLVCTGAKPTPSVPVDFARAPYPPERCLTIGFPRSNRSESGTREIRHLDAPLTENHRDNPLEFRVPYEAAPNDPRDWSGLSGGAVTELNPSLDNPLRMYGVIQHVPASLGHGTLEVARVDRAFEDPKFLAVLTEALGEPPELVRPPGPPSQGNLPQDVTARLQQLLYTFDRHDQADGIATLLDMPPPLEALVCALPEDVLDLFAQRLREDIFATAPGAPAVMPMLEWPTSATDPGQGLRIAKLRLSRAILNEKRSDISPASLRAALSSTERRWVRLHISASAFGAEEAIHLRDWRQLWHDAAQGGLEPCGVVYTVEGVADRLPPALANAFAGIEGREAPVPILLPACTFDMLQGWPCKLRDQNRNAEGAAAAEALRRSLEAERGNWSQFRLGRLKTFLEK